MYVTKKKSQITDGASLNIYCARSAGNLQPFYVQMEITHELGE